MVRCLVNRDDIVSRLSLSNAKSLAKEILARRPHWEPLLSSDLDGVYERKRAPNQRRSFDVNGGDGNDETKSIEQALKHLAAACPRRHCAGSDSGYRCSSSCCCC